MRWTIKMITTGRVDAIHCLKKLRIKEMFTTGRVEAFHRLNKIIESIKGLNINLTVDCIHPTTQHQIVKSKVCYAKL